MTRIVPVTMPKFGLSMTEGKVAAWLVEDGQKVAKGAEIADIETSKITNSYESPVTGTLRRRTADIGIDLPVGALIAVFADDSVTDEELDAFISQQQAEFNARQAATATAAGGPEPKKIAVGDIEMRYLETGNPEGDTVILVHGFGGDLNNWLFTQPALSEIHRVIAIDLPGHGGSSKKVGSGSIEELGDKLLGFMSALNIPRAALVGHSLGGAVIISAARKDPSRVASLTLLAPVGFGREINDKFISGFIQADRRKTLQPILADLFADPSLISRDMIDDILKFKRLDGAVDGLNLLSSANFGADGQRANLRDAVASLTIPVQAIWGDDDKIVPASHADTLPANVKRTRIKGVGHMPHLEAAAAVNEQLAHFLAQ